MPLLTNQKPFAACSPSTKRPGRLSRMVYAGAFGVVAMAALVGAGYGATELAQLSAKIGPALNVDVDADLHDRQRQAEYLAETKRAMQSQITACVNSGDCVASDTVHGGVKINLSLLGPGEVLCSADACENRQQGYWRAKAWAGSDGEIDTLLFNPSAEALAFQKWTPFMTANGVQWKTAAQTAQQKDEALDRLGRP